MLGQNCVGSQIQVLIKQPITVPGECFTRIYEWL